MDSPTRHAEETTPMTNPTPTQHHRDTEITNEIWPPWASPSPARSRCATPPAGPPAAAATPTPQATRPLHQLDPQGRGQDRHPAPQRRAARPIRTLVPSPPAPTGTPGRTRSPLPGDHRERTTPGNRPQQAQPQTATKNTGHLGLGPSTDCELKWSVGL